MNAKIIQIVVTPATEERYSKIFALTETGRIYSKTLVEKTEGERPWVEVPTKEFSFISK